MTELKSINGKFFKYIIDFTPFQIKSFKVLCKNNKYLNLGHTFRLNYAKPKNKKKFVVFLTKSQIKDVNKAKKNKGKYNLFFSYIQIGETCSSVIKLNDKKVTTKLRNPKPNVLLREKLAKLRLENPKKINKIKSLKLANLRLENQEKRDKIKSLKPKQEKINFDTFIKNTIKKYNKPKPKKKKITDMIKFPEINLI